MRGNIDCIIGRLFLGQAAYFDVFPVAHVVNNHLLVGKIVELFGRQGKLPNEITPDVDHVVGCAKIFQVPAVNNSHLVARTRNIFDDVVRKSQSVRGSVPPAGFGTGFFRAGRGRRLVRQPQGCGAN